MDRDVVQLAWRSVLDHPLKRGEHVYGLTDGTFCAEKAVLKRITGDDTIVNGKMVQGRLFHQMIPEVAKKLGLVKEKLPPLPGIKNKLKAIFQKKKDVDAPIMQFDFPIEYVDPRGFTIVGHPDADCPQLDMIIELKTTGMVKLYDDNDFFTRQYIVQANGYACIRKRSIFTIWILWNEFEDMAKDFITTIDGIADKDMFDKTMERIYMIDQAVRQKKDMVGPEQPWECRHCTYFFKCPHKKNEIAQFKALMPTTKKAIIDAGLIRTFDALYDRHLVKYDNSKRIWEIGVNE